MAIGTGTYHMVLALRTYLFVDVIICGLGLISLLLLVRLDVGPWSSAPSPSPWVTGHYSQKGH